MWFSSVSGRGAAISGCRFRNPWRSDDMTKVAAVILAGNAAEVERQSRIALGKGADLVELRLDAIADLGPGIIRHLAKSLGEHAIATLRSPGQGGAQRSGRSPRSAVMREICGHRFAYVDLELEEDDAELDALARVAHERGTRVIVSHHFAEAVDIHRTSEVLEACAARGDIAKVVAPVDDVDAAIHLIDLARTKTDPSRPIILIGTGTAGGGSRGLAASHGGEIPHAGWGGTAGPGRNPRPPPVPVPGRD